MENSNDYSKLNLKEFANLYETATPAQKKEMEAYLEKVWPVESRLELANAFDKVAKNVKSIVNKLVASDIFDALNISQKQINAKKPINYSGLDIKKYCRVRGITEKQFCKQLGIEKSTVYKYERGGIDVPSTKLIQISDFLNVSTDLLLKRKNRELQLGFLGDTIPLLEYDYKKQALSKTNLQYALDKNLKGLEDKVQIIKYSKPIYELSLPKNAILFIVDKKDMNFDDGISEEFAALIEEKDKAGRVTDRYFSYIQRITGTDKDYSSAVNYNYQKDGKTYTTSISKIKELVSKVILKAVIDF